MIITNTNNLPRPLVEAVSRQRTPTENSISITTLISPPQIRILTMRHWEGIEEDASDRLWATMGSLMHVLLEGHAGGLPDHHAERTLDTEVEGMRVTGTFDLFVEDGTVSDYKFVSVWTTMNGVKPEWTAQLNLYAELLRRTGARVDALQIVAIYRDWSKNKANASNYPAQQVQIFPVPLWSSEHSSSYLTERVRLHRRAAGEIIQCTDEERWARPTKYALMKRGRKTALKLFDDRAAASSLAADASDLYVEERPGAQVRCESYCAVARFCPQYKRFVTEMGGAIEVEEQ